MKFEKVDAIAQLVLAEYSSSTFPTAGLFDFPSRDVSYVKFQYWIPKLVGWIFKIGCLKEIFWWSLCSHLHELALRGISLIP